MDEDFINMLSESMQREPKLKEIFGKIVYMSSSDLDALLGIIGAMIKDK